MPDSATRRVADRYQLRSVLGRGGAGAVWLAEDVVLGREVAVKAVDLTANAPEEAVRVARARVVREARAAARLNHPHAVTVFDVVQEDGSAYLVMQLVRAPTLHELVQREGPLSPKRAAALGLQVLSALQAAHEAGIVHRDVKPANVMVREGDQALLADFGIASLADDPGVTATGIVIGSPSYMAPEQAYGKPAGPPVDLWGLGATLWFAVEGRPPFQRGDPLSTLQAVTGADPDPLRQAGPLAPLLHALLRKDPAERPAVPEVVAALRAIAEPPPQGATAPAPREDPGAAAAAAAGVSARAAGSSTAAAQPVAAPPAAAAAAPPSTAAAQPVAAPPAAAAAAPPSTASAQPAAAPSPSPVGGGGAGTATVPSSGREGWRRGIPVLAVLLALVVLGALLLPRLLDRAGQGDAGATPGDGGASEATRSTEGTRATEPEGDDQGVAGGAGAAGEQAPDAGGEDPADGGDSGEPADGEADAEAPAPQDGDAQEPAQEPAAPVVPEGWVVYTDPDVGYTIAHPPGWSVVDRSETITDFREPGTGTYLRVDWTDSPPPTPESSWQELSDGFAQTKQDYEVLQITPTTWRGFDAALWEYRYTDGRRFHATNLGIDTGPFGYALNFQTREENWAGAQDLYRQLEASFQPRPV